MLPMQPCNVKNVTASVSALEESRKRVTPWQTKRPHRATGITLESWARQPRRGTDLKWQTLSHSATRLK